MEKINSNAGQGLGIAGIVLGILALFVAFIPCVGLIALIPGITGIILSSIGLVQANRNNGARGLNLGALIVSIIGTLVAALWVILFVGLASLDEGDIETAIEDLIESQSCNPDLIERSNQLEQKLDSLIIDPQPIDSTQDKKQSVPKN